MEKVLFYCRVTQFDNRELGLSKVEYMVLLQMRVHELEGNPPLTRSEIISRVAYEERMVDGAIAELKRRGFIERRIVLVVTTRGQEAAKNAS